jgi:hypothetical protein
MYGIQAFESSWDLGLLRQQLHWLSLLFLGHVFSRSTVSLFWTIFFFLVFMARDFFFVKWFGKIAYSVGYIRVTCSVTFMSILITKKTISSFFPFISLGLPFHALPSPFLSISLHCDRATLLPLYPFSLFLYSW